jgi:sugar/nucleoside kinase (ribokinase family)
MSVLVVGSIALDDVKTPKEARTNLLGGSASYAAVSASFFSPVQLVGIVGHDFPQEHVDLFEKRQIDLAGLQRAEGPNFRWSGEYMDNMNNRETLSIALNVFEDFTPDLPDSYKQADYVLLGNIAPSLQLHVLNQLESASLTIADTMDLWIDIARAELDELVKKVDVLILNDGEAAEYTGESNAVVAGKKILAMGPKYVVVKKGEHGALLFGEDEFFTCGAFPLEEVVDPTGAGDTFAGGFTGYLASLGKSEPSVNDLRKAVMWGTVMASFNVEHFSADGISHLDKSRIDERAELFRRMCAVE